MDGRSAASRSRRRPGASLVLTLDEQIQHVVERELAAGVRASGAERGSAIVMDPFTGEILAMANAPTFNPNDSRPTRTTSGRIQRVQDVYEPGSTFKVVTAGRGARGKAPPGLPI